MMPSGPRYEDVSDADLIRSLRSDSVAFEVLFERHAVSLRRWLLAQTEDMAVANDLVAETFARVWLGAKRFRGANEHSGRAWLYGIARNLVLHHHRQGRVETSARRRLRLLAQPTHDGDLDSVIESVDAERLAPVARVAFEGLEREQRLAIGYRVITGLSYGEVASRLDCDPTTARTRVHRGLRKMRRAIEMENE